MSRLGDLLHTERLRRNMTLKQVAKLGGVSEGYLKDVEAGTRIIADDQARRILKKMGLTEQNEAGFSLDDIAATVDLQTAAPKAAPKPAPRAREAEKVYSSQSEEESKNITGGVWLDALSSVLQPVPVMNAGWIQVARRMVPIQDGKIEGAKPERVVYFQAPDDSMRAMRIEKGDLVLVVPQALPVDGAIMLVEYGAHRCLRRIRLLGDSKILLQSGDRELDAQAMHINELKLVGRAVRIEIAL